MPSRALSNRLRILMQENVLLVKLGEKRRQLFYGGGVHYALHRTPLLAPLHTLTAAHSLSYTCFLIPPINNGGCSQPCLRGMKKGHYRAGRHLSELFDNLGSQEGSLLQLIGDWTTEHKFPLAIVCYSLPIPTLLLLFSYSYFDGCSHAAMMTVTNMQRLADAFN